jgi:molybdopterin/thiamine biosynthesis adenylyltransferase
MPQPFVIDDEDRYSRLRLIAWWDQDKLARAKVMVVGAGALGNEVLKNLALLGVGTIYIVDFEEIESSNLTRSVLFRRSDCGRPKAEVAATALRDLNPEIRVKPFCANIITDIGLGLWREVDVVIGCLDNREARLWVNRQCWKAERPWIDGGIQEINGVVKLFVPPDSACYECAMTENDYRLINLRYSCPLLRQEDLQAGKVPTAPTISSIIAGLQTQEALKLIHGMPVAAGHAMIYNGVANQFYTTRFQRREDCLSHEHYAAPLELPLSASKHTAADLFHAATNGAPPGDLWQLELDRDLVISLECTTCHWQRDVMRPLQIVSIEEARCVECGQVAKPHLEHTISSASPLVQNALSSLGIAPYDIVRISAGAQQRTVLLAGDRDFVLA